jgi:hypothetical protein
MGRQQLIVGAVAAVVLVAIVAITAAGGGGVKQSTVTPTPAPAERGPQPLFGGSLPPGVRYQTRFFVPALSFAVADGDWLAQGTTQPDRVLLVRRIRTGAPGGTRARTCPSRGRRCPRSACPTRCAPTRA